MAFPKSTGTRDDKKFQKYFTISKFGTPDEALKEAEAYAHDEAKRRKIIEELRKEDIIRIQDNHIQPKLGGIRLRLDQRLYVVSTLIPGKRGHQKTKVTVAQWNRGQLLTRRRNGAPSNTKN